jgi:hypothetical protein
MLARALADGVIALGAHQSGWFSVRTTREFAGSLTLTNNRNSLTRTATPIVPSNGGEPANMPA